MAHTSRRQLFGASAAMLLLGSVGAGEGKAAELDGELLRLEAQLQAKNAEQDAFPHADDGSNWPAFEALQEEFWTIADQIEAIPARTPEGLQAKARAVLVVRQNLTNEEDNPLWEQTAGLIRDLLGAHA